VSALAIAVGFAVRAAYHRQPSSPAVGSRRTVTACTQTALTKALDAGNPQPNSLGWTLTSFACARR
jgi:hypothetical protein